MIKIDKEKCIGCGACAIMAQDIFELGEDGKARIKADVKIDEELARQTVESCPVNAIILEMSD